MRSALVLVGGEARRAEGKEKSLFEYEGRTFIEILTASLRQVTDEIILAARDPEQCSRFSFVPGVACVSDIRKGVGPLGGLHAGATAAHGEYIFVSACDMPCVNPAIVRYLFECAEGHDAAVPCHHKKMLEPLHAVYRREPLVRFLEDPGSRSMRDMYPRVDVRYVPVQDLRRFDPDLLTFTNINRLDELELFRKTGRLGSSGNKDKKER